MLNKTIFLLLKQMRLLAAAAFVVWLVAGVRTDEHALPKQHPAIEYPHIDDDAGRMAMNEVAWQCASDAPSDGVVVVGAGISGLAAARAVRALSQGRCHVRLIEARPDRIGGRAYTVRQGAWAGLDFGSGWIHSVRGNPLVKLAKQMGLRMTYVGGDSSFIGGIGISLFDPRYNRTVNPARRFFAYIQMKRLFRFLESHFAHAPDMPLETGLNAALEHFRFSDDDVRMIRWYLDVIYGGDFAAPVRNLSLHDAIGEDGKFWGGDVVLTDGYGAIIDVLARDLDIELGVNVTDIQYSYDGVIISSESGKKYYARKAIVTLPVGVLNRGLVSFRPPLPPRMTKSLSRFDMAILNRIILKYNTPFWPENKYTFGWLPKKADSPFFFSMAVNHMKEKRHADPGIISFMVGGDTQEQLDRMSKADIIHYLDSLLRSTFHPSKDVHLIDSVFSSWQHDPYCFGAYTYAKVNGTYRDRDQLGMPVDDVLFFAGEHTEGSSEYGTTHAAYMSGIRAARMVMSGKQDAEQFRDLFNQRK